MNYQTRKGIVLKNICGEWLLIAVGDASEYCMYVRQVNDTLAFFWQQIELGKNTDEIIAAAVEEYDAPEEEISQDLDKLIPMLCEMNYLIAEPAAESQAE